jgi:hypothetical protein
VSEIFRGRIAVDLDRTLAYQEPGAPYDHQAIGDPVPEMARRVAAWLEEGMPVVIFTARLWTDGTPERSLQAAQALLAIQRWTLKHFGVVLPVTCVKDPGMLEIWDDRAVQVVPNTGRRADGQ